MSDISEDKMLRALGSLAKEQQDAMSPELEVLMRPLSADVKERMAQRALAALQPAKVLAPARGWGRAKTMSAVAVPLALAASLVFAVILQQRSPALPDYEAAWSGGLQELRAEPSAPVERLGPNAKLQLLLRPAKAVDGAVSVRLFAIESGKAREWKARAEVSDDGAIRVSASGADLGPVAAPELEVVAVVSRPGELPSADQLTALGEGHQVFRRKVQWQ
jgi:hypothetical protein